MVNTLRSVRPFDVSRVFAVLLTLIMLSSGMPLGNFNIGHARAAESSRANPTYISQGDEPQASSRFKEYPNTDAWQWINPFPANDKLNDVAWQPAHNVATMVGHSGLILEKQGSYWATVQSNTYFNLWHVEWRPSGDYALIVGNYGEVIKYQPGAASHIESGTSTRLQGVGWKSDGSYALICGYDGLLMKFDGSTFTTIQTGTHKRLYNVSYSSLAGWLITGEGGTLMTYDEPTGKVTTISTGLDDMIYNLNWKGDMALIVGGNGTILKYQSGIVLKVTNSLTPNDLFGVEWDTVNNYALITGTNGEVLMYTQAGVLTDISPTTSETLDGVSFMNGATDALIVGTSGTVLSYVNGVGWSTLSSDPFPGDYKDVAWAPNGSYALIIGSQGKVLKYTNINGLKALSSPVTVTLRALAWVPNGTYALIVGDKGTVMTYNGTGITVLSAGVIDFDLYTVDWRSDGQYALIAGSFGKILKFDGTNFYTIVPEDQAQFFMFSVAYHPSNSYALMVGASGIVYKCEEDSAVKYQPAGIKCLRLSTGVFTTLKDVEFRADGDYAIIAGMSGVVLKYKADNFETIDSELKGTTWAVTTWKTGSIYPVLAGSDGTFAKYSGYGVVEMPCPSIASINGISWNGTTALVVGERNQIMKYDSAPLNEPFASIYSPGTGAQYTVADNIIFSAFNSLAPDDASAQFFWLSNISGPLGTEPRFTSKLPAGHHRITLYVNASGSRSDSDHVEVYVKMNQQPPHPVISSPVDGKIYNTTDNIYFDASKSTDPNGDSLSYFWSSDIEGFLAGGTGFYKQLSTVGIHMISLYANDGTFNRSATVNITIKNPNRAPEVTIVTPKAADVIHEDDQIKFEATAIDKDQDSMKYSWFSNITGFLDNHKVFMGSLVEGKHKIEFHAEDPYKHNSTAVVNVTVLPKVIINLPPLIDVAWPDNNTEIFGTVNISGTAQDLDGTLVVVEFQIGGGPWRAANGTNSWSFKWDTTNFTNGNYNFSVRAYDGQNHTVLERSVVISNKWKDVHAHILYPANDLELSGDVKVTGTANHDQAAKGHYIRLVQIRVDHGPWQTASGTDTWTWTFKTGDVKNGAHTIEVMATDDQDTNSVLELVNIRVKNESTGILGTSLTAMQCGLIAVILLIVVLLVVYLLVRKPSKPEPKTKGKTKGRPIRPIDEEAEAALDKEMAKDDKEGKPGKEEE